MAISANVVNGELQYNTSQKKQNTPNGSNLGYDQFLQLLCAEMQYQDPLEPTSNTDYVAQLATFSQLEATLSLGQTQDNDFASTLTGKEVIVKVTDSTNGKESYVSGTVDYVMYQDGDAYLSINDQLYPLDSLDTVAYSGYSEAVTTAKTLASMVEQLPPVENVTVDYKGAIQEIRDLYDGLSTYQQSFVDKDVLEKFESIEAQVRKLEDAKQQETASKENVTEEAENEDTQTEDA